MKGTNDEQHLRFPWILLAELPINMARNNIYRPTDILCNSQMTSNKNNPINIEASSK